VLSDHVDWPGLETAIDASGASRVLVTHGDASIVVQWLRERGLAADTLTTEFADEGEPET
jgi:putative mRNA 3-end processing factor